MLFAGCNNINKLNELVALPYKPEIMIGMLEYVNEVLGKAKT